MTDTDELTRDADDLHALMERAVSGLEAPTDRLGTRALAGGRRARHRRRLGTAALAAAAVAAVAVGLPQVTSTVTPDGSDDRGAASRGEEVHEPDGPPPEGWWDMPSDQMFGLLGDLLPPGVEVTAYGIRPESDVDHEAARGWVGGHLEVDGTEGTSSIEVLLYSPESLAEGADVERPEYDANGDASDTVGGPPRQDLISCPGNLTAPDSCEEIREDGKLVGRMVEDRWGDLVVRDVSLLHGDGMVYVAAANSTSEKWNADSNVSAAEPPLSLEQLRAIAEGPWSS
jgi:hypothetical protein